MSIYIDSKPQDIKNNMQFIDVAIDCKVKKIDQLFSYSVPAEFLADIKVGALVIVPFRGRKLQGIILNIKRTVIQRIREKIKPINKVIGSFCIFTTHQIKLAQWISEYYLTPIGKVLFSMFPAIAIRHIHDKKVAKNKFHENNNKPQIYTLYERFNVRIEKYILLAQKAIRNNRQIIILMPEISLQYALIRLLGEKLSKDLISHLHSNLTKTQRFSQWLKIKYGEKKIIVGSRSAIFAPCANLGLIIIDRPDNFSYKEEQSPKFNAIDVAKKITKINNCHLILGSFLPSINTYYFESRKLYKNISKNNLNLADKINLIDIKNEFNKISWKLEDIIRKNLEYDKRVLLFINKKDNIKHYFCRDCQAVLNASVNQKNIICPKCLGSNLNQFGVSTNIIENELKKLYPHTKTIIVEKDSRVVNLNEFDIVIATQKVIEYKNYHPDIIGVINIDHALGIPDIFVANDVYNTIVELIEMCKAKIYIQTKNPENNILNLLAENKVNQFLENELALRKKYLFPPYANIIKITAKLNKKLNEITKLSDIKFSEPINIKGRWQMIIKSKDDKIKETLKNLAVFNDLSIDVNPVSLL